MTTNIEQESVADSLDGLCRMIMANAPRDVLLASARRAWRCLGRDGGRAAHVVEQEPVAASIVSPRYVHLVIQHHKCRNDAESVQAAWDALIQHIDQHCAAQVAQALAAVDPVAQTLMRAGHAPREAMQLAIDGRINAALAAKPDTPSPPDEHALSLLAGINRIIISLRDGWGDKNDANEAIRNIEDVRAMLAAPTAKPDPMAAEDANAIGRQISSTHTSQQNNNFRDAIGRAPSHSPK